MNQGSPRIKTLDLLRFIAALGVLGYHYFYRGFKTGKIEELGFQDEIFFKFGYLGVNLFFIISGFVIFLSLNRYQNSLTFIKNRIIRLFPTYILSLCITLIVIYLTINELPFEAKTLVSNFLMVNWIFKLKSIDGVYWSLHIEWIFYFLMAFFLLVKRRKTVLRYVKLWFFLLIAFKILGFIGIIVPSKISFLLLGNYGFLFIAGIFFYQYYIQGFKVKYLLIILTCFAFSSLNSIHHAEALASEFNANSSHITLVVLNTTFFLYFFALPYIEKVNKFSYASLGVASYPLYLLHQEVGYVLYEEFRNDDPSYNTFIILSITLTIVLVSILIGKKYEKPVIKYLKSKLS